MTKKWVVAHYLGDYNWVKDYTDNFIIYTKIENLKGKENVIVEPNVGYNLYSYFSFIIDNYKNLPDVSVFIKANILDRHITKAEFDKIINNNHFTPLLTQEHRTDGIVNYYNENIYWEKNNSWYFAEYPYKFFRSFPEFAEMMGLPNPNYLPFACGANYIVPKENILKHPIYFYIKLRDMCGWSQINAESHTIERALYLIWNK